MEIVNLSHNDNIPTIARKCNQNFKQLAWSSSQAMRKQGRMEESDFSDALIGVYDEIASVAGSIATEVSYQIAAQDIPGKVSDAITAQDIPQMVNDEISSADIPGQVADALDQALGVTMTSTLSDFFTEDGCTVTACNAMRWGSMAFIRFSYRLNSALTVPSNGDIADVTLGKLKVGWRPFDMTNVILDQTRILIGDVDSSGDVKVRSANSRGTSYTIDANAVLYASMMLMLGLQ